MSILETPQKPGRTFLPDNLVIDSWDKLEPYFKELEEARIESKSDLNSWLQKKSELDAVLEEDMAWRYIRMSINTRDKEASDLFHFFVEKIEPNIAPYQDKFDRKLKAVDVPEMDEDPAMAMILKKAGNRIKLFREENIPIQTKLQAKAQEFGSISSEMSIEWEGKKLTLQQASVLLKETDRTKREEVYNMIQSRRLQDKEALNDLFTELIEMRTELAKNADLENFRDYKFVSLNRFDYTKEDCFNFHESIAHEAVPLIASFDEDRKSKLGLEELKPWDMSVDPLGKAPLKPFENTEELVSKTIECFNRLDPYFGRCIEIMSELKYLDLDSRDGKAPGGFNYPLYEIGVPFIYMNSAGTVRDMVTMMHEGGHAVHSFLSRDLELTDYKDLTSEVAELASMSMELMSMEHWDVFFSDSDELKRAKREQLQQVVDTLPWVAQIDKFQHWIYENPVHTITEREEYWLQLMEEFNSPVISWKGQENSRKYLWQKQLHLYEVPFLLHRIWNGSAWCDCHLENLQRKS